MYGMKITITDEVVEKLDMFQDIFEIIDKSGWWYLEIISVYAGIQFTSTEFQYECKTCGVWLTLSAPEHK